AFIQSIPTLKILIIMHFIMIPAALIPAAIFRSEGTVRERLSGMWSAIWRGELIITFFASFFFAGASGHLMAKQIDSDTIFAKNTASCVTILGSEESESWTLFASSSSYFFMHNKSEGVMVLSRSD